MPCAVSWGCDPEYARDKGICVQKSIGFLYDILPSENVELSSTLDKISRINRADIDF